MNAKLDFRMSPRATRTAVSRPGVVSGTSHLVGKPARVHSQPERPARRAPQQVLGVVMRSGDNVLPFAESTVERAAAAERTFLMGS
jgi:hypothetical protein